MIIINRKILYSILTLIILISITIGANLLSIKNDEDIITYELQTSEYFENAPHIYKYKIDSIEELNKFYSIYSNKLTNASSKITIDDNLFKNNTMFILVNQTSSGSIKLKLTSVTFENNNLDFNIEKNTPQIVTNDMSFWYLVAVIPKSKLKNINTNNWNKPSNVIYTN